MLIVLNASAKNFASSSVHFLSTVYFAPCNRSIFFFWLHDIRYSILNFPAPSLERFPSNVFIWINDRSLLKRPHLVFFWLYVKIILLFRIRHGRFLRRKKFKRHSLCRGRHCAPLLAILEVSKRLICLRWICR